VVSDRLPDNELGLPPWAAPDVDAKLVAALERVGQALRVQMWDTAKQHGLTPTQLQVLLRLASDPPARRRIGVLAGELDVTHPTVSDAVAVLRRKGLVDRDPSNRKAALSLSTGGQAVAAGLADWDRRTRRQLADLPVADKHAALRLVLDLIAGLHSRGDHRRADVRDLPLLPPRRASRPVPAAPLRTRRRAAGQRRAACRLR
jgi:DNA-binding MarR family transcriptional regulator